MAYRLFPRSFVAFDNLGQPLAGGIVRFYDPGTTDAADVYDDSDLGTNLGSEEVLDSAGRFQTGIWGNQSYRVRFYAADGVTLICEDDPITDPAGAASGIPSLVGNSGEFLSNNGTVMQWVAILQQLLPDMSGHAGKLLTNDGSAASWASLTALGLPAYTDTGGTHNLTIGPYLIQFGNDTFPVPTVSPPHGATKALTFPTAFNAEPLAYGAFANEITIASSGFRAVVATEATATTLTADYNVNENTTDPGADVGEAIRFSWFAIGYAA